MPTAVLDTDVLVNIYEFVRELDKERFHKLMDFLALRFRRIWLPETVKEEFLAIRPPTHSARRNRWLERTMSRYAMWDCPIRVSASEIAMLVSRTIHEGEADGILQAKKAESTKKHSLHTDGFVFLSNDRRALEAAQNFGLAIVPYYEIREQVREYGLELP